MEELPCLIRQESISLEGKRFLLSQPHQLISCPKYFIYVVGSSLKIWSIKANRDLSEANTALLLPSKPESPSIRTCSLKPSSSLRTPLTARISNLLSVNSNHHFVKSSVVARKPSPHPHSHLTQTRLSLRPRAMRVEVNTT